MRHCGLRLLIQSAMHWVPTADALDLLHQQYAASHINTTKLPSGYHLEFPAAVSEILESNGREAAITYIQYLSCKAGIARMRLPERMAHYNYHPVMCKANGRLINSSRSPNPVGQAGQTAATSNRSDPRNWLHLLAFPASSRHLVFFNSSPGNHKFFNMINSKYQRLTSRQASSRVRSAHQRSSSAWLDSRERVRFAPR